MVTKRNVARLCVGALTACLSLGAVSGLTACSGGSGSGSAQVAQEDKGVTETKQVKLEGLYVDDSYKSETGEDYRLVYVPLEVTANKKALNVSTSGMTMTIGDHEYEVKFIEDANSFMRSYRYLYSEIDTEEIPTASSQKMLFTFEVHKDDLKKGKEVTFASSDIDDMEKLKVDSGTIKHAESHNAVAKAADPDGYAAEENARQDADAETVEKVRAALNGTYSYYPSQGLRIEFFAPNSYTMTFGGQSGSGTYEVKNGYITLDAGAGIVAFPWSWEEDGSIDVDMFNGVSL